MRRVLHVLPVLFVFALVPSITAAQAPAAEPPWRALVASLPQGAQVTVQLNDGEKLEGSVIERAADSLTLRPRGTIPPAQAVVAFSDIASVERGWKAVRPWWSKKRYMIPIVAGAIGVAIIVKVISYTT